MQCEAGQRSTPVETPQIDVTNCTRDADRVVAAADRRTPTPSWMCVVDQAQLRATAQTRTPEGMGLLE